MTALVIAALVAIVDWHDVFASLREARPAWTGMAVAATLATFWCRSRRLRCLLPAQDDSGVSSTAYFRATLVHQAIFVVLPSGTGDAALPLLARSYLRQSVGAATAALLSARVQDLSALIALGGIATIWLAPQSLAAWLVGLAMAGLGGLMLVHSETLIQRAAVLVAHWLAGLKTGLLRNRAGAVTGSIIAWQADHGVSRVSSWARIWTLVSWLTASIAVLAVFAAIDLPLTSPQAVLVLIVLNLAGAASFIALAGVGVVDASLVLTLVGFGLDYGQALSPAIAARALLLGLNALLPATIEAILVITSMAASWSRRRS